jgi:hypothetical protein
LNTIQDIVKFKTINNNSNNDNNGSNNGNKSKINNNKNIPFSMLNALTKNLQPVALPTIINGQFFNPADGVYDTNDIIGYQIFDVFKHLVSCMSDNLIDFASNLFEFDLAINHLS